MLGKNINNKVVIVKEIGIYFIYCLFAFLFLDPSSTNISSTSNAEWPFPKSPSPYEVLLNELLSPHSNERDSNNLSVLDENEVCIFVIMLNYFN